MLRGQVIERLGNAVEAVLCRDEEGAHLLCGNQPRAQRQQRGRASGLAADEDEHWRVTALPVLLVRPVALLERALILRIEVVDALRRPARGTHRTGLGVRRGTPHNGCRGP